MSRANVSVVVAAASPLFSIVEPTLHVHVLAAGMCPRTSSRRWRAAALRRRRMKRSRSWQAANETVFRFRHLANLSSPFVCVCRCIWMAGR